MASYDIETLLIDVKEVMTTNLNTKITDINTEKNDTTILSAINAAAYLQDMDDSTAVYDPFVLYMVTNIDSEGIGPATMKTVTVNIAIILVDSSYLDIINRMWRYGRALEEIFEEKWKFKRGVCDFKIESLPVLSFQLLDESQRYKVVGINLISSFA